MRVLFPLGVAVGLLGCTGTGSDETGKPPGELGVFSHVSYSIEVAGETLYRNYGDSVYSVDVSDPRSPQEGDSDAYSGISCGGFASCYGFEVSSSGNSALLLDYYEVSSVALPNAMFPSWLLTLPDASRYAAYGLTRFGPGFAVARYDLEEIGHGDILLLDLGGGPGARILTDFMPELLVVDGERMFTYPHTETGIQVPPAAIVFDVSTFSAPVETARIPIPFPDGFSIDRIAVSGSDLVATSVRSGDDEACFIGWYRFDSSFSALTELGRTAAYKPEVMTPPIIVENRVIVAVNRDCPGERPEVGDTVVLSVGSSGQLTEYSRTHGRSSAHDQEIDVDRQLLYVGGDRIQILDLGLITTGTPAWE